MAFVLLGTSALRAEAPATTAPASPALSGTASAEPLYPTGMLSPQEEQKTFHLPPGYHMELVLAEPEVREPVSCVFDGNGRMYVAEMRTYMLDIDATHEHDRESLVSRHESTHGDGVYDRHTIFADHLLLPRELLPLDRRVLIGETDSTGLKIYRDTKGSGAADEVLPFFTGEKVSLNMEHQESGPIWGIDNWLYSSVNNFRLRWTSSGVVSESTPSNGGQWGVTQDDYGRQFWSNGGAERGLLGFQVPIIYGRMDFPSELAPDFLTVWPLVPIPDVQGGQSRFRPVEKTLNHFTASCGQEFYRGDRLPEELRGEVLMCEPVGRLIRRIKVDVKDGITCLSNPDGQSEFIRSTDANFRPVNITTGPDGCLYIVDMYRGIIQEGNWTRPGSYLRPVIQQYGLDKNIGGGRIWRLVHDDFKPGPMPHMLDETPAQLVAHLDHPNGWWRLEAQKQIVLRQDKSVVPTLQKMARADASPLGRIHALWTLEGLGALRPALVRDALADADPHVRCAALRAGESLWVKGDRSLLGPFIAARKDTDAGVRSQALMTAKRLELPDWRKTLTYAVMSDPSQGIKLITRRLLLPEQQFDRASYAQDDLKLLNKGREIFEQVCFACHGYDGKGMPMEGGAGDLTLAPPLAGSRTVGGPPEGVLGVLLHGVSGTVEGKTYTAQMVSMSQNDDEWIASIASFIRNAFGNVGSVVRTRDVALTRAASQPTTQPWTREELARILPRAVPSRETWKATASDNPVTAALAIDGKLDTRYSTGKPQAPGQWFQVELPAETPVCGMTLRTGQGREYPRGFKVQVSPDGQAWSQPVAQNTGSGPVIDASFPAVHIRFIRITLTSANRLFPWSIGEIELSQPPNTTQ